MALYQKKLDNEIGDIVSAARPFMAEKRTGASPPSCQPTNTLGYNKHADVTRQIMVEVDWYKPSFPPMPRVRINKTPA